MFYDYPNIISSGLPNAILLHWYLSKQWCKDVFPGALLQHIPLCIPPAIVSFPPATLHLSVPSCNSPLPTTTPSRHASLCPSSWVREDTNHLPFSAPTAHLLNFQNKQLYISFQVSPSVRMEGPQNTLHYNLLNPSFLGKDDSVQRPLHHAAHCCFFVCLCPPRQQSYFKNVGTKYNSAAFEDLIDYCLPWWTLSNRNILKCSGKNLQTAMLSLLVAMNQEHTQIQVWLLIYMAASCFIYITYYSTGCPCPQTWLASISYFEFA